MAKFDSKIYHILKGAKRNAQWALQGNNPMATDIHIQTTLHLIEMALSSLIPDTKSEPTE